MTAIWSLDGEKWELVTPSGFPAEEALHDLVEQAPNMLPLAGDPQLTIVGREVHLGGNKADVIAVEPSGRLAIIEIKLKNNAEARRAVIAQILTYAAFLRGLSVEDLQASILGGHLARRGFPFISAAAADNDQTGSFDPTSFGEGLRDSLASGRFRLILVLDEAPPELVQLVGYLEAVADKLVIDLVTVAAYSIGGTRVMVPQRVEPERVQAVAASVSVAAPSSGGVTVPGAEDFEAAIADNPPDQQPALRRLVGWARQLEAAGLARLSTRHGKGRTLLLTHLPAEGVGLITIYNERGASINFHRTVFERRAPLSLPTIEATVAPARVGQGTSTTEVTDDLLDALTAAYREAASGHLVPS